MKKRNVATYPHPRIWGAPPSVEDARKFKSQQAASKFARLNKIEKPTCECLSTNQVEMHHIDYDRPYIVAFMCHRCHMAEHAGSLQRAYRLYDLVEMVQEQKARAA